jgi:hypothetical protein
MSPFGMECARVGRQIVSAAASVETLETMRAGFVDIAAAERDRLAHEQVIVDVHRAAPAGQ